MWKENIQRLFRYRKITPSPRLWEQLEMQLAESEAQETRFKRRKAWYYGIAASLIVCLGIGYLWQLQTAESPITQQQKSIVDTGEKESISPTDSSTFAPIVSAKTKSSIGVSKSLTATPKPILSPVATPALKSSIATPTLFDINEVDSLFAEYTADAIERSISKEMEKQIVGDLKQLSAEDLALIASTQAQLNQYVAEKYQQDKSFITIEKELLKDKVKLLAEKLLKEIGTRVVSNNKN